MLTILTSLLLAIVSLPAAAEPASANQDVHEGKVVNAGEGKIAIVDDNGENEEFEVNDKTKITRNDKPAGLDDIQEGDLVRIKLQRKGTVYIALVVQARTPE